MAKLGPLTLGNPWIICSNPLMTGSIGSDGWISASASASAWLQIGSHWEMGF